MRPHLIGVLPFKLLSREKCRESLEIEEYLAGELMQGGVSLITNGINPQN